jgi:alkanesulfonate monooxygenase SsuD/methylene tetrahydromethanopterin reductase-like flavin-dependent oxidoreductase (luciferase family)
VPVDIAGTGQRVIAHATAPTPTALTIAVGANPERISATMARPRRRSRAAGRSRARVRDQRLRERRRERPDRGRARDRARQLLGDRALLGHARRRGEPGLDATQRNAVLQLAADYDMAHHGSSLAPHARALPDAFIDGFAVVGDVARVTDRLRAIADTGVDRIVVIAGSLGVDMEIITQSIVALSTQVLPKLR